jgi:hypothetical protein
MTRTSERRGVVSSVTSVRESNTGIGPPRKFIAPIKFTSPADIARKAVKPTRSSEVVILLKKRVATKENNSGESPKRAVTVPEATPG